MKMLTGLAVLVPVLALEMPGVAHADDTPCNTTITGTYDNVVAIPGGTRTLSAATACGVLRT